jgi:hypothetical protein
MILTKQSSRHKSVLVRWRWQGLFQLCRFYSFILEKLVMTVHNINAKESRNTK